MEARFSSIGESFLPFVICALRQIDGMVIPSHVRDELIETLLTASKIGRGTTRQTTLEKALILMDENVPDYLHADAALQQSAILRLCGDFESSEQTIDKFFNLDISNTSFSNSRPLLSFPTEVQNRRVHALHGFLHVSHLENLVQTERHNYAVEEMENWSIQANPSLMELRVLPSRALTASKIFRSMGRVVWLSK